MYGLISFQANGEPIEHAGQKPEFYALTKQGRVVDYFGTLAALHVARTLLEREDAITERASEDTEAFRLADKFIRQAA